VGAEEEPRGSIERPGGEPEAPSATSAPVVVVAARNEVDRIAATLIALADSFPGSKLVVADDASDDATGDVALAHGAEVVSRGRPHGKGANVSAAVASVIERASEPGPPTFLLCDGDLGDSARELPALVEAVESGECEMAIAAFRLRVGGGFGVALRYARRAIERLCGFRAIAPISGQRALSADAIRAAHPFADGYGMEIGITVDVVRAGLSVREIELDLSHRATGRSLGGFLHRARQLRDFRRVMRAKRRSRL
jgi:glycosyltransferase involved in cell wall biosynthesis